MLLLWVLWPTEDTPGIWPLPFFTSNGVATAACQAAVSARHDHCKQLRWDSL